MRKRRCIQAVFFLAFMFFIRTVSPAYAVETGPDALLSGRTDTPVTVTVSEPSYKLIARFGQDLTESLNRVLGHLSLSVTLDGELSETVFSVDGEPAFSSLEIDRGSVRKTIYSFEPDTAYTSRDENGEEEADGFTDFLERQFHKLNRLLDDLYPFFEKTAETFSGYSKTSAVSLNFRGYGKGVRQTSITLPAQYVSESFQDVCAGIAETEESRQFLKNLVFKGTQRIILLYDQDGSLLQVRYNGEAGTDEENMRSVSIVWRSLRDGTGRKDHLTLKTPAKKGNDRYNLTYERDTGLPDDPERRITWNLQIDLKEGQVRKKISCSADLSAAGDQMDGRIEYSEKQDGPEISVTIVPAMKKENGDGYTGTIEITDKSGKIVTSSFTANVTVAPGGSLSDPGDVNEDPAGLANSGDGTVPDAVRDRINSILVTKLLTLPPEDLGFFSSDIPAEDWNAIVQSF